HHIANGACDQHLARLRELDQARRRVHGDPPEPSTQTLALSRVQPGPDLESQWARRRSDGITATDRVRRRTERSEEPISGAVNLASVEPREQFPYGGVMRLDQPHPGSVAQLRGPRGRSDDIGEEQ